MAPETWSYFVPAAVAPVESSPAPLPQPASTRHRGWQLAVVLVVALVVTALSVLTVSRAVQGASASSIRAVAGLAPGSRGWGPAFVDAGNRPARWDPCQPIHYVVGLAHAPPGGLADIRGALARLSAASGLDFVEDGSTEEVPRTGRPAYDRDRWGERWAPLLVAWVSPSATDIALPTGVEAATISVAVPGPDGASLVTGEVAISALRRLPPGFGYGATEGEVLLHELGHAVGLGHVDDPHQVMYPTTTSGPAEYGAGDLTGLAALGRPAGCHRAPAPHELEPVRLEPLHRRQEVMPAQAGGTVGGTVGAAVVEPAEEVGGVITGGGDEGYGAEGDGAEGEDAWAEPLGDVSIGPLWFRWTSRSPRALATRALSPPWRSAA